MSFNDSVIERARHLISISRYEEAIKALQQVIATEPDSYEAHVLLAASHYALHKYQESFVHTGRLISLAPDRVESFYYHSLNFAGIRDYQNAEKYIREALSLDSHDPDCWGILSWIYIIRNNWEKALEYAEEGLRSDPEHVQCLNHKSSCLIKLDRLQELDVNLKETLARDPDNYYSHANAGWAQLEKGEHAKAKEHFMESLRLNPGNEAARNGVIQSLKARNWFFRLFLQYYFWIAKHKEYAQWAIVIGVFVGGKVLRLAADRFPVLMPVYILFSILVFLTWIINPVFNLFLRLDPLGKHVLNKEEKTGANLVGTGLLLALICLFFWWRTDAQLWLFTTLFFATSLIPISHFYELAPYQPKRKIGMLTLAILITGIAGLGLLWTGQEVGMIVISVYFIGIWGYGWLANFLVFR